MATRSTETRRYVDLAYEPRTAGAAAPTAAAAADGYDFDDEADWRPRDECGVFAIHSPAANASRKAFFALYALNHRGQESAGIASMDDHGVHVHKGMGLVSQVFTETDIGVMKGRRAIGHTRYSTAGGSKLSGAQPFVLETDLGPLAMAHNGQVAEQSRLRRMMLERGTGLFSTSDTEVIAQMLARAHDPAHARFIYERESSSEAAAAAAAAATTGGATTAAAAGAAVGGGAAAPAAAGAAAAAAASSSSSPSPAAAASPTSSVASGGSTTTSRGPHPIAIPPRSPALTAMAVPAAAAVGAAAGGAALASADMGSLSLDGSGATAPTAAAAAAAPSSPVRPTGGAVRRIPSTPTSSTALASAAARATWPAWVARMAAFMADCEGAYSLVALTRDGVYGLRDPLGLRPLCIGRAEEEGGGVSWFLSSESCAFGTIGAEHVREVLPGEIIRIDDTGIHSYLPLATAAAPLPRTPAFCIFEYVYFSRPDSILENQMVHTVRTKMGARLALEAPTPGADIVSGVPDSSLAAAIGYAGACGLPFTEVFCKNRYIGRTFIKPDDSLRKNAIQLKYNPLTHVLAGKSVVLVDDSLVRGNTLAQLVPLLRKGGAREVHIRISSPPIRHPCYMGVDIGSHEELIAHHEPDVEGIRKHIGADSLAYLSLDGMVATVSEKARLIDSDGNELPTAHCVACFTGEYPLKVDGAPSGC